MLADLIPSESLLWWEVARIVSRHLSGLRHHLDFPIRMLFNFTITALVSDDYVI